VLQLPEVERAELLRLLIESLDESGLVKPFRESNARTTSLSGLMNHSRRWFSVRSTCAEQHSQTFAGSTSDSRLEVI